MLLSWANEQQSDGPLCQKLSPVSLQVSVGLRVAGVWMFSWIKVQNLMKHVSGHPTVFVYYQCKGTVALEKEHVPVWLIIYATTASKAKKKKEKNLWVR